MPGDTFGTVAGDALLALGGVAAAIIPSVIAARRAGQARNAARAAQNAGAANAGRLDKLNKATNGELAEKIKQAVREVAAENPGIVGAAVIDDELRGLLDAMLRGLVDLEEKHDHRHGRRER